MTISAELVKELRNMTGVGIIDCKKALIETDGNINKAVEFLRKKGLAQLEKKSAREAKEGLVDSYCHAGRIGVMVEVNCETDFVARNEKFKNFAHDIAMQIAASNPLYIDKSDVPEEVIEKEKEIYRAAAKEEGKPENILDKIAEGKINKYYESACLLQQPYIKNPDIKVKDLLGEIAGQIGENISIRRFVRYQLGEKESE